MPAVRRQDPTVLVHDLTRRLAEEFAALPIPSVTSAVQSAVAATELFGENVSTALPTIEQLAREDLLAVRAVATEQAQVPLAS